MLSGPLSVFPSLGAMYAWRYLRASTSHWLCPWFLRQQENQDTPGHLGSSHVEWP